MNNHRQFLLFVSTLVVGICLFDYLTYACQLFRFSTKKKRSINIQADFISSFPSIPHADISSCPLPTDLCIITTYDCFLVSVACWATLQLLWTVILLASQLLQVARQMTSLEVSNLGRYGFMGGRGGASLSGQMSGHHHHHGRRHDTDNEDATLAGNDASSSNSSSGTGAVHRHSGICAGCGSGFLMNLLGFDRFTKGKAVDGLARAGKASNPFDLGIVGNCKDFWTAGKELGVNYEMLYDVPLEGFREAKRRNREVEEDGIRNKPRKGLFMGFGLGRPSGSRAGYEPVSQA